MNQAGRIGTLPKTGSQWSCFLYNSYKMTDQNTGKSSAGKKRTEGGIPYKERDGTCGK
jgi:hypothetical protein